MRREMVVTPLGMETLEQNWVQCLREHLDNESVLRSAFIALLIGGKEQAANYLAWMGEKRSAAAEKSRMEAEYLESSQSNPLSTYAWMRGMAEARRRKADAETFMSISQSLREWTSGECK